MDFPSARAVFLTVLFLYLALQLFLFRRLKQQLHQRFPSQARVLSRFTAAFFVLMLYPLFWRILFGIGNYEPFSEVLRSLVGCWALGSSGLALLFMGRDLWQRARGFFSASSAVNLQRREFLKKGTGIIAAAPFAFSGYGVFLGRVRFRVEDFDLWLPGLPADLDGLTIVQLTDIHAGPFMTEEQLASYVDAVNRLEPDLIVLTGDFVSFHREEVVPCVRGLEGLKARYGIYGCLGNHDFYARAEDELTSQFAARGIRLLRNDAVAIPIGNSRLGVLGVDDLRWGRPNLAQALRAANEASTEVRILLSHRPEIFPRAARRGVDVVLSGHYHGGQIKLVPGTDGPSIASFLTQYPEGLFHLSRDGSADSRKSLLFVSRGIGVTALPVRFNCPPQIAHLTLRKA